MVHQDLLSDRGPNRRIARPPKATSMSTSVLSARTSAPPHPGSFPRVTGGPL